MSYKISFCNQPRPGIKNLIHYLGIVLFLLVLPHTSLGQTVDEPGLLDPMPMGINLSTMDYFSPHWVWKDVFKSSRDWIPQVAGGGSPWNTGETLRLTPGGWPLLAPGQAAGTLMFRDIDGHYPAGTYTVTYEGKGNVIARLDAQNVESCGPGCFTFKVDTPSSRGIHIRIDRTLDPNDPYDPQDPVRNIKVLVPGVQETRLPFHPLFLKRLSKFSVIRFTFWQNINNSTISQWSERTTRRSVRQSGEAGVALEYMIQLCNNLDVDPWFSIPHLADDDYVRRFATMVKKRMDRGRKIYVEYSSEVWNTNLSQGKWAQEQGLALGLSDKGWQARYRFYSQKSVEIFKIWEEVFGADSEKRLVRVLASQNANPFVSTQVLEWQSAHENADVLAIAPYFGRLVSDEILKIGESATVEDVFNIAQDMFNSDIVTKIKAQQTIADRFNLPLITYEGGQTLSGRGPQRGVQYLTKLMIAANRHPCIYDMFAKLFTVWAQETDADLFTVYNSAKTPDNFGSWGILEHQDQPLETAFKFKAVLDAVKGQLPEVQPETILDCGQ